MAINPNDWFNLKHHYRKIEGCITITGPGGQGVSEITETYHYEIYQRSDKVILKVNGERTFTNNNPLWELVLEKEFGINLPEKSHEPQTSGTVSSRRS